MKTKNLWILAAILAASMLMSACGAPALAMQMPADMQISAEQLSLSPAIPAGGNATSPAAQEKTLLPPDQALSLALEHLGVDPSALADKDIDLERGIYEVEFEANGMEYECKVDAFTGKILKAHSEPDKDIPSPPAKPDMTADEALALVLDHMGITGADIFRKEIDFDDGWFELEIKVGRVEYEFKVNAATGKVIETDRETEIGHPSVPAKPTEPVPTAPAPTEPAPTEPAMTREEALALVLQQLGISADQIRELEFDFEKGRFELEFKVGNMEYEFELSITGKILRSEKEKD